MNMQPGEMQISFLLGFSSSLAGAQRLSSLGPTHGSVLATYILVSNQIPKAWMQKWHLSFMIMAFPSMLLIHPFCMHDRREHEIC